VELIPELSGSAKEKLDALGYNNIFYRVGDGSEGWEEYAPFDRVITAAAAGKMPDKLFSQLKPDGVAIAPVGPKGYQDLLKIRKNKSGSIETESLGKVTFVKMKGEYEWEI
jgi:protein-L-isoaspartate(D-aspartate) O-methyltransferase